MIKVAFLGDIALFADGTLEGDWKTKFQEVADFLSGYDLVVAHLEAPITERSFTAVCKGIHLKTTEKIIDVLKMLNVKIVCLANNHMCDFGMKGLYDTVKKLDGAGIAYYGVNGRSETVKINGEMLSFHGYCCYSANGAHYVYKKGKMGVHALIRDNVLYDLQEDVKRNVLSVLSMHWGDEYSSLPN